MMSPPLSIWLFLVAGAVIGIWLQVRAWQQFQDPEDLTLAGARLFLRLLQLLERDDEHTKPIEDLRSNQIFVRLFATGYMAVGALSMWLPIMLWLLVRLEEGKS